eukprot:CAMPEP_0183730846 /NCGR_PEP_ID=MMETSP0737-20130205/33740_1 /TAXON_ID=385413 /ORGANISM="Thalassiosira miniscula, Strain CCMP1093" /LENGTH=312 /DNA_ID=CAMNT_0025963429 /DNA_START=99 /DNA_END=1037 /DNA_ORIENTATION=-
MSFQRVAFLAASALFLLVQLPQDASGFGVNPLSVKLPPQSKTAIYAGEPGPYEKAAELRKKAEDAKRKAEELKKVAEQKAEAAMVAVKKANDKSAAELKKEEPAAAKKTPTPPAPPKESRDKASTRVVNDPSDGAIIALSRENIEFTSGVLGGALALVLGASPVLAVVAAAATNYVSKKDDFGEANELVQGISKASLSTFNWFAKLDSKYSLVGKLSESLDKSIQELKASEGESAQTVKQIEETVSKTSKQLQKLAEEIDLIEGGKQALGAVGEVVETSIDKAVDANKEYKLTDRAAEAAKKAVENAKESQK